MKYKLASPCHIATHISSTGRNNTNREGKEEGGGEKEGEMEREREREGEREREAGRNCKLHLHFLCAVVWLLQSHPTTKLRVEFL